MTNGHSRSSKTGDSPIEEAFDVITSTSNSTKREGLILSFRYISLEVY